MFDYTAHNGNNYLKGHCFVGLVLSIPLWYQGQVRYLSVPIRYRLRSENENKLELATEMIEHALQVVSLEKKIILLYDSWYLKRAVRKSVSENAQLELISNVRVDMNTTCLLKPTDKRGRPAKKGQVLTIQTDFEWNNQSGDYVIGTRKVLNNSFPKPVYAMVTANDPEEISPNNRDLLPYHVYGFRWSIEVIIYEQKTFWSFGDYTIRSKASIENYINFTAIVYSCVQLISFQQIQYAHLQTESAQIKKQLFGRAIQEELFFYTFVSTLKKLINSLAIIQALNNGTRKNKVLKNL